MWHVAIVREEFERLGYSFCASFWYVYAVALVVVWGHAQIPAVYCMFVSFASLVRGLMDYYLAAGRRNRGFVVVKKSIEYFIR